MPLVLEIALLSPPFLNLSYLVPEHLEGLNWPRGLRVLIPLAKSLRVGLVWGQASQLPDFELKEIVWALERAPLLNPSYLEMIEQLASRQMQSPAAILGGILPLGLRTSAVKFKIDEPGANRELSALNLCKLEPAKLRELAELWSQGLMREPGQVKRCEELYSLACEPPWPVRPGAKRQIEVLEALFELSQTRLGELKSRLGRDIEPILKKMLQRGLVAAHLEQAAEDSPLPRPAQPGQAQGLPGLTPEQREAFARLERGIKSGQGENLVLHGITGSGKTRLYLEAAAKTLAQGQSVMLLAPEVALAAKLWRAVKRHFPCDRAIYYHGYLSPAKREQAFREAAAAGPPAIVAGTRSALFLPLPEIGLIVLDEEHDSSFKQDERLNYQAKEIAYYLAKQSGAALVLGSATPDVKTYQSALEGNLPLVCLKNRIGGGGTPAIELVDLNEAPKPSSAPGEDPEQSQALAPQSLELLLETVSAGQQAIIMLNRRGYAPLMYCLDCKSVAKCPHCEVSLTFHKRRERLVCHYCGLSEPYPRPCASCGSMHFLPLGLGSEMLEEQLKLILPRETGVLRLDRDSTRKPGKLEEILASFAKGEAQVLIGTQMISKGHHFPEVTLVIVADGDMGLNLPDYRASERTFQLLLQVAGRAGRGEKPGRVLIQTRNPDSPFWEDVLSSNYESFFAKERDKRKRFGYPPFVKLGLIRASFPASDKDGLAGLSELAKLLRAEAATLGVKVLGPAPAPLARLKNETRFHCLLKAGDWPSIRQIFAKARDAKPGGGKLKLRLDLDPLDML